MKTTSKTTNEIKLKRCPFCGGEAVIINTIAFGGNCKSVMCIKCKATVNNFAGIKEAERAAEAWNRRYNKRDEEESEVEENA